MLSLLSAAIACYFLVIGILVVYQAGFNYISRIFFALCFTTFMWQGSWALLFQQSDYESGRELAEFGYIFILFLPTTLYHFLAVLGQKENEVNKIYFSYAFAFILAIVLLTSDKLIAGVYDYLWGYYPRAGLLHPLHVVQTVTVVFRGLYISYCKQKSGNLEQRTKLRYCIASLFVYSLATVDYLCNYGVGFYPPGIIFISISLTIICYAIVKYKLMDLSIFVSRIIGRLLCIVFFVFAYLVFFSIYNIFSLPLNEYTVVTLHILYVVFICILYPRLIFYLQKIPDQIFLEHVNNLQCMILQFTKDMHAVIDYKSFFRILEINFIGSLDIDTISLFISADYNAAFKQRSERCFLWDSENNKVNYSLSVSDYAPELFEALSLKQKVLLNCDEDYPNNLKQTSVDEKIVSAIPCLLNGRILGLILLQSSGSNKRYTVSHEELFNFLSFQSGILLNRINLQKKLIKTIKNNYEEKSQFLKTLAGSIAHEIRNPFNAVAGYNAAIENYLPKPAGNQSTRTCNVNVTDLEHIRDALTRSNNAIQLGGKITDAILLSMRNETIEISNFNYYTAQEIISYAFNYYGWRDSKDKDLVHINTRINFQLIADRDLLIYVFFNLIKNALYYKHQPGFKIEVSAETMAERNLIIIKDYGPGIVKSKLQQIFKGFHTSGKKGGTGLGLPFCKHTMKAFKGDITCDSEEGSWTTFTLSFPWIDSEVLSAIRTAITEQQSDRKTAQEPDFRTMQRALAGKHFLVVDDEETNRYTTMMMLLDTNCDFHEARDGNEALQAVQKHQYDAILSDFSMPEMNGDLMTRAIKTNTLYKRNQATPIIMITGKTSTTDKAGMLQAGAAGVLSKPINKEQLTTMLFTHLITNAEQQKHQYENTQADGQKNNKTTEVETVRFLTEKSGLDLVYAVENYGRHLNQIKRELEVFLERSEGLVADMHKAYVIKDYKAIEMRLHKIAYFPQIFGLREVTDLIRVMEGEAAEGVFRNFAANLAEIEGHINAMAAKVEKVLR